MSSFGQILGVLLVVGFSAAAVLGALSLPHSPSEPGPDCDPLSPWS